MSKQDTYSAAEQKAHTEIQTFLKKQLGKNIDSAIEISSPPKQEMGDFAVALFSASKKAKQQPNEMAVKLASEFKPAQGALLGQAKAFGPYLNFFVDRKEFAKLVLGEVLKTKSKYGQLSVGKNKRVMIEYSQPNTHKEFHVGHLRTTFLGSTLVKMYKTLGYKTLGVNYIGDIGAHVAKCLWALQKFHENKKQPANKGKFLGQVYVEAVKKIEGNEAYKKEASVVQQKLENGDAKLVSLWKKTRQWSLDEFYAIYKRLGVDFDHYFFESEVEKPGKRMVEQLMKRGIAKKSEGAVIIDLEKWDLKKFLLLKSDGTSLYSTKDLALAGEKFEKYKIDKSLYVVDFRQSLYFKQLFKTLEILGFKKDMAHISYNSVNTKEGAMSSRSGNVVLYEDFEKTLVDEAVRQTKKRHVDWKKSEVEVVSKKIAYASMKHDMLAQGNNTVITFDIKKSLDFQGRTAAYLLYVFARISSILKKAKPGVKNPKWERLKSPHEHALVMLLAAFPQKVFESATKYEPSILVQYLHDVAKSFSVFYQEVPILKSDPQTQAARLALISAVRTVMDNGLALLGIESIEKM